MKTVQYKSEKTCFLNRVFDVHIESGLDDDIICVKFVWKLAI